MITKWKVFNFKSVGDETALDFGPLTIFAGPNSSGKSTCIQSILLICQTLRNPIGSRSVILNGALTRLGQFNDLKTAGSDANQILIGWELRPPSRLDSAQVAESFGSWDESYDLEASSLVSVKCDVAFDARLDLMNDVTQLNPQLFSTLIDTTFRDEDGVDHVIPFGLSRTPDMGESKLTMLNKLGCSDAEVDRVRSTLGIHVEMDQESYQESRRRFASAEIIGCDLLHFLPQRVALVYNNAEEQTQAIVNGIFGIGRVQSRLSPRIRDLQVPVGALAALRDMCKKAGTAFKANAELEKVLGAGIPVPLVTILDAIRATPMGKRRLQEFFQSDQSLAGEFSAEVRAELKDDYRTTFTAAPRAIQVSSQYMRRYFSQAVKYLGPLRDEPKALYPLASGNDPFDVGLQGENTAAVLDLHKTRLVRFIPPSAFSEPAIKAEGIVRTLQSAVIDWLRYLCIAESVESIDRGKLGHELKVTIDQNASQQDLTHVGVGVSQVLPILVMCLIADKDDVLLFEQPELHLHPRVQTLLGDFFLSMALMNKQCLIETHSEYLINRLRFRAAASPSDDIAHKMTIYFVEKDAGRSHFRSVVVNEFGAIVDWPEGFFDKSQKEAEETLRAAMSKKRKASPKKA
jgi:predicted ATPase